MRLESGSLGGKVGKQRQTTRSLTFVCLASCLIWTRHLPSSRVKERQKIQTIFLGQFSFPEPWPQSDIPRVFRVEKYRPVTLDDVVSHKDITTTSENEFISVETCLTSPSRAVHHQKQAAAPAILWSSRNGQDQYNFGCRASYIWGRI